MKYDSDDNSKKSCEFAINELRLQCIRNGSVTPRSGHPDEMRAWHEGEKARKAKS